MLARASKVSQIRRWNVASSVCNRFSLDCKFDSVTHNCWKGKGSLTQVYVQKWSYTPRCCYSKGCYREEVHERLTVNSYGEPKDAITKEPFRLPQVLGDTEVLAKVLASPINPADINTIQGVYSIKPPFPFVPGNEALLEIVEAGAGVKELCEGDRVIPRVNAMGTWQTALVADQKDFIKVPSDVDIATGATIAVNPCTAYRMLTDFVRLRPGDVIVQNCANSSVGQAAIQIAAAKGIQTINIVRQRPNFEELKSFLISLGGTIVVADSELRASKEPLSSLGKPLLALNGVSGKSGTELLRLLADGGTMVTYGGMARAPVTVPVGSLIFNDVKLFGFWMTRWNKMNENNSEREAMLDYLFGLSRSDKLAPPTHEFVPFEEYERALSNAMPSGGMVGKKQILRFG